MRAAASRSAWAPASAAMLAGVRSAAPTASAQLMPLTGCDGVDDHATMSRLSIVDNDMAPV